MSFSVPTGDIDNTTTVPTGGRAPTEFPYPMRLGSGTFNLRPGVTWKHYMCQGSFGAQVQTDIPLGTNYDGYSVSEVYQVSAWYSHLFTERIAVSTRLENLWRTNFDGFDRDVMTTNPRVISTNRADMRGGYWLNLGLGLMVLIGDGNLFNLEVTFPLHQDLEGIQLETDFQIIASFSRAF